MKPEWRTDTVVQLCLSMRETQDFGALPILADALQDVDCDLEWLLAQLRCGILEYHQSVKLVATILSDETFQAVEGMERLAKEVNYEFSNMIEAGREYLKSGCQYVDPDRENWDAEALFYDWGDPEAEINDRWKDQAIKSRESRQLYWKIFFLITGLKTPEDFEQRNPFICPC